jgi:glycosyltransferase involved in cell wall biosynthesis
MHESETNFHNLEFPAVGAGLEPGWQQLRGWLVPKSGFHFVDVRARIAERVFPGVYGFPRVDLAAHFAPTRRWLPAEYTIDVELARGTSVVVLEALSLGGQWEAIHTFSQAAEGAPRPRAPQDPLPAEEFGFAVQLGLKQLRHGAGDSNSPVAASVREQKGVDAPRGAEGSIPYPPVLRPNHPPFHGFIDEPAAIAPAMYGRLNVLGWLFHETLPIRKVSVTTDLLAWQPLELGGNFPGVQERFPQHAGARNCRLFGFADVSSQLPTPVTARFYAELEDGSTHLCLAVQSQAVGTERLKAPYPTFSARKFWTTWRATRRAFDERATPLEGGKKLLAQFGKTFRRYREEAPARIVAQTPQPPTGSSTPLPRPHRLLLITHNLNFEGAPLLFVEYARYLSANAGAQLVVLSGQEGPLRAAFVEAGADVKIVDAARLLAADSPADFESLVAALAVDFAGAGIQAVVANTLFNFWGVALAEALRCRSLLYIHESTSPVAFFRDRISPGLLPAVYDALEDATAVSFNTAATEAYYRPYASGKNFCLTSAWIDLAQLEAFRAAHSRAALRGQFRIGADELLVVNVGTVCDRKGQHDFVRAVEWLWRSQPALAGRCRFLMIGGRDTPYNRFLQQSIVDLGRANLAIVAETDRAFDYFAAADLFVCTSYEESFPRVVLEAMAFALPIVSTAVHGIAYLLRPDEDAWLVNPGDVNALAEAMVRALEFPTEAKARAAKAQGRVREYDAARVLPRHAALTATVAAAQL